MTDLGRVAIPRSLQEQWKRGTLAADWAVRFPNLFDEDDLRLATSQGPRGNHFSEWIAALMLHRATGYLSLVQKYEFANHARKQQVVRRLLDSETLGILRDRSQHGSAQAPDLLMYSPDFADWFFCEVKGPGDRLRAPQLQKFQKLAQVTGRPVRLLRFAWAATAGESPVENGLEAVPELRLG